MARLSEQLRGIANAARAQTQQQSGIAQAANTTQLQGQIAQGARQQTQPQPAAADLAGAMTAAQGQPVVQAAQQQAAITAQAGQAMVQQTGAAQAAQLQQTQDLNDEQIRAAQRSGEMRQNSEKLKSAKQLQSEELQQQQRLLSSALQYDDKLSFLTTKQRTDLAGMDRLTKQQVFDARLSFQQDELGRQFSNSRQLADFAVATAKSEEQLKQRLQDMQQAAELEVTALQTAQEKITQRMQFEFNKAEQDRDHELLAHLSRLKSDADKKAARKRAQASATSNIITGVFTIGGAAVGFVASGFNPLGAVAGASVGVGAGQAVAGGVAQNNS